MKLRQGFVSNSSSSSFLVYGVYPDNLGELYLAAHPDTADVDEDSDEYTIGELLQEVGLNVERPYDGACVGLSWDCVEDNETGAQFKQRVEDLVCKELGEGFRGKLGTHSEAWYN